MDYLESGVIKDYSYKCGFANTYSLANLSVKIATNSEYIHKIISGSFLISEKEKTGGPADPDLDISVVSVRDRKKIKIPDNFKESNKFRTPDGTFTYYKDGSGLIYMKHDANLAFGNQRNGKFIIFLKHVHYSKPLFMNSIILSLRSKNLFSLHSALLEKDGGGILLAGKSGCGKTTLALNLSRRKFSYVCDDICLATRDNLKRVNISGLANLAFKEDFFEKDKPVPPEILMNSEKRYLPKVIIFSNTTNYKTCRLLPVSSGEGVAKLINLSHLMCFEENSMALERVSILKDLSSQCRSFQLQRNSDPRVTSEFLTDSLLRLMNG